MTDPNNVATIAGEEPPTPLPARGIPWALVAATSLVIGLVVAFYLWTASSPNVPFEFRGQKNDYYNLLTDGFLGGHLYMKVDPHPDLLSADPAIRARAPFLLDASLYRGRYYLYFGVTPVLVLFLPWAVVSGHSIPDNFATVLFAGLGFILSVVLLWRIRRRQGTASGTGLWLVIVVALGFCTVVPAALRRGAFYEVAICSGYAFTMLFFIGLEEAMLTKRRPAWWLTAASLSYGLAVGSRVNLVFGGLLLPAAVLWLWWPEHTRADARRRLVRLALPALLPAALCLAGLLIYNYARFDDFLEPGWNYQFGIKGEKTQFAVPYLWHNLRLYYFTLPEFSRYFPFFYPGRESLQPPGYFGREFAHGQFFFVPLALLALVGGVTAVRRQSTVRMLLPFSAALAFWFLCNGLIVGLGGMRANRYMIDFQPALLLLTCLGVLTAAGTGHRLHRVITAACVGLLLFGSFYNTMISLQADESFRQNNRPAYERLARVFDHPSWWYQRLTRETIGPLALEVAFPKAAPGTLEPLVATGTPWFSDVLFVHYLDPGTIRFVLEHAGYGGPSSPPITITPDKPHRLEISLGSLYPPEEHPFFSRLTRAQMRLLKRTVRIDLDGATVFRASASFYDASPGQVYVGENWLKPAMTTGRFSGRLLSQGEKPFDIDRLSRAVSTDVGPAVLRVEFPRDRPGAAEPLVVTGTSGRADVLFVQYLDNRSIRFGLDHWSHGAIYSPIVPLDYAVPHEIEIHMGSLYPPSLPVDSFGRQKLAVKLDGREVFATRTTFYDADAFAVDIGCNSIGASSCRTYFGGNIFSVERLGVPSARSAPEGSIHPSLLSLRFPPGMTGLTEPIFSAFDAEGNPLVAYIHYAGGDAVQLGVLHQGSRIESPPVMIDYKRFHLLLIGFKPAHGPSLANLGPLGPYFETRWADSLCFYLDGQRVLAADNIIPSPDSSRWFWAGNLLGASANCAASYTGFLEHIAEDDAIQAAFPTLASNSGPLRLAVMLPLERIGRKEPLVTTGITGGGDSLYIEYADERHVRFGFDHWGEGGPQSAPLELAYDRPHTLVIWMEALSHPLPDGRAPAEGDLWVEFDGRRVWTVHARFHPAPPSTLSIGANFIGISSCDRYFTGEILAAERAP